MTKEEKRHNKLSARPISKAKELFLALCLIGREISPDTIKMFKRDYGENYVKRSIVYELIHQELIVKIGYRQGYGYMLTERGREYLEIKAPNKYNYDFYADFGATHNMYNDKIRERNKSMTSVLYYLVQQGVSITNHYDEVKQLLDGKPVNISEPIFIPIKELRNMSERLMAVFASSSYGCVISSQSIVVIYAPDKEHHLWLTNEVEWKRVLTEVLQETQAPYNNPQNYGTLYLYKNIATIKDSFEVNATRIDNRSPSTRRCYLRLNYCNNYGSLLRGEPYQLKYVLDKKLKKEISDIFYDECELSHYNPTIDTQFCDGVYEGETLAAIMWTLNPTKMMQIIEYIIQTRNQVLILCFTEQVDTISNIISINKSLKGKVLVYDLSRDEVMRKITSYRSKSELSESKGGS